jgi:hypothetical protein
MTVVDGVAPGQIDFDNDPWIGFYNTRRPHQTPGMKIPAEAFALTA